MEQLAIRSELFTSQQPKSQSFSVGWFKDRLHYSKDKIENYAKEKISDKTELFILSCILLPLDDEEKNIAASQLFREHKTALKFKYIGR